MLSAELSFGLRFYLGVGAPAQRRHFAECNVRAARGYSPGCVHDTLMVYLGRSQAGSLERVNYRAGVVTLPGHPARVFVKEFPWHHRAHDVERWLRLSRADRAWRAAHLLPQMGLLTPAAVGTAQAPGADGKVVEYLVTEWLEEAFPFPDVLAKVGEDRELRATLLQEFATQLRFWHSRAVYSRDLMKNVLVRSTDDARVYWLTDLDGVHPIRRVNPARILFHLRQLAYWSRPLRGAEAMLICQAYAGTMKGEWAQRVVRALTGEPPASTK